MLGTVTKAVAPFIVKHKDIVVPVTKSVTGTLVANGFCAIRTLTHTNRPQCYFVDDGKKQKTVTIEKVTLATKLRDKDFTGYEDNIYREIKKGGNR